MKKSIGLIVILLFSSVGCASPASQPLEPPIQTQTSIPSRTNENYVGSVPPRPYVPPVTQPSQNTSPNLAPANSELPQTTNHTKYSLKVFVEPPGAGSVSNVSETYYAESIVNLIATPANGYKVALIQFFNNFDGGIGGQANSLWTFNVPVKFFTRMDSPIVIVVYFTSLANPNPEISSKTESHSKNNLEVFATPLAGGSVFPTTGIYDPGSNVTVVATPANGYIVSGWSVTNSEGSFSYYNDKFANAPMSFNVTMDSLTLVKVYFQAPPRNAGNITSNITK